MNCELLQQLLHGNESVYLTQTNLVEFERVERAERVNVKSGAGDRRGGRGRGHPQAAELVDEAIEMGEVGCNITRINWREREKKFLFMYMLRAQKWILQ